MPIVDLGIQKTPILRMSHSVSVILTLSTMRCSYLSELLPDPLPGLCCLHGIPVVLSLSSPPQKISDGWLQAPEAAQTFRYQ